MPKNREHGESTWPRAIAHALPIAGLVLALVYYWFAIADRHIVFLYCHNMGPAVPDTTPFSRVTASRYWMSGLVAGGVVLVAHTAVCWLLGRVMRGYTPPSWWRLWAVCSVPLVIGVPLVTMTANSPTLPLPHALKVTLATLVGLALALAPGQLAAKRPVRLALLAVDGVGIGLVLFALSMIERVVWMPKSGRSWALLVVCAAFVVGIGVLAVMTGLRRWRRCHVPNAFETLLAALCLGYLLMPLVHHVGFTDGYFYISDQDNFYSRILGLQIAAWLVAAVLAEELSRLRRRLAASSIHRTG